ncbi:transporter, major facilitator family [Coleofasciculus chthonoplastes PCC 7420]|uniref:Transporter, major facilitator family n=1 Tax=Coleofasciculus chthonoplastes PCC 7420 TaxID=118168 RepID=B4W3D7_9CYAN|nr:OFA family MFS transporter [Coleofasciculus chthonoplastes]EDX71336.1 transporter, major facilitator family [Coleofasciculus chthonoplastes PCC 7420]
MDNWQSVSVFGLPAEKGRWFLIPLGSLILLCLGTVYSWSIFRKPLEDLFGISATQSLLPFTVLLVLYALLMPITGFYIDKIGVSKITAIGGVVTGIGYILSSFATNIILLTITYGVIAGAGVGIAYGVPLAVSAKWFPDRKGLAVGLTAIGFGLSPLVTAPLAKGLIEAFGVLPSFAILGISLTGIILVISITLKLPPVGWKPQNWTPKQIETSKNQRRQLLRSPSFYALWFCYTIGTFVGLSAIGISSPVAQEIIQLDATTAAITVSIFAVFNGIGRPLFGWLTDRLQPKGAAIISYVLILIASILMLSAGEGQALTYLVAFSLFWLCLGGWLAIAPTATLILFPPEDYAKNYGIVFTAYGAGALLGTLAIGQLRDLFGSYTYAFYPTAILAIIGIIIAQFKLRA